MVGGEGQRESAALVLDPWLVTPYLATPVAWSGQVAPVARGAGGRGLALGGAPGGAPSGATTNLLY